MAMFKLLAVLAANMCVVVNGQAGVVSDIPDTVCADIADSDSGTPGVQPDGLVGVDDLLVILSNFRRTGTNVADLNGDMVVDVEDLLGLLAQFHSECVSSLIQDDPDDGIDTDLATSAGIDIVISNDYIEHIADTAALADCYVDPDEMAANAEMQEFITAFKTAQAENLGVSVDEIRVDGLYTDGDDIAGCSHALGQDIAVSLASTFIDTLTHDQGCGDDEYPGQHTCGGWSDCTLNVAEMANDPEAIELIERVIGVQCEALGLEMRPANPDPDGIYCEDVVEVDGISLEGCTPDACVVPEGAPDDFCSGRRRAQTSQLDHVMVHVVKKDFSLLKMHVEN